MRLVFILVSWVSFSNISDAGAACFSDLDFLDIETSLALESPVKTTEMKAYLRSTGKIPAGTTEVYLVEFENGLKGVFKPKKGQGAVEVFAYELSKKLKLEIVPPTILRTINGRKGSLQLFIESPYDLIIPSDLRKAKSIASERSLADIQLFSFLAGKTDSNLGNRLIDSCGTWISIDNDSIRRVSIGRYGVSLFRPAQLNVGGLKGVLIEEFPFENAKTLPAPSLRELKTLFSDYIQKHRDFQRLHKWGNSAFSDNHLTYVIWNDVVWAQSSKHFGVAYTDRYQRDSLEALRAVTEKEIKAIIPASLEENWDWVESFMSRRKAVLDHAESLSQPKKIVHPF